MDDHHRKAIHSKKALQNAAKYPLPLDSPAYDASEEDNDATDDGASGSSAPRSAQSYPPPQPQRGNWRSRRTQPSALSGVVSDDGVDSPTYDGDVESTSTVVDRGASISSLNSPNSVISSLPSLPPSTPPARPGQIAIDPLITPPKVAKPLPQADITITEPSPAREAAEEFDPASFTPEEVQAFVRKAIDASQRTLYPIARPPTGRPIRVYADGVYDLFHFGHALQLRQAKLSFSNVYLLVGVCSDELCLEHKSRTVMSHAERCEAARHCRWVDQVVPDGPWTITQEFIDKYQIDYVAHDDSPYPGIGTEDVYAFVKRQGKFIPTRRTPGVSTSELLERIVTGYRRKDFDKKLESMGASALKAAGSDFEDDPASSSNSPKRK